MGRTPIAARSQILLREHVNARFRIIVYVGGEAALNPNIAICMATLGFAYAHRQPTHFCKLYSSVAGICIVATNGSLPCLQGRVTRRVRIVVASIKTLI